MRKTQFLQELKETLEGEVSASIIQSNLSYYDQYISQETSKGRSEEEVVEEIGSPRLIAKTIIDSNENSGDEYQDSSYEGGRNQGNSTSRTSDRRNYSNRDESGLPPYIHYIDLNKWYWKLILSVAAIAILFVLFALVGGVFALLIKFAGPILLIWMIYIVIKNIWQ